MWVGHFAPHTSGLRLPQSTARATHTSLTSAATSAVVVAISPAARCFICQLLLLSKLCDCFVPSKYCLTGGDPPAADVPSTRTTRPLAPHTTGRSGVRKPSQWLGVQEISRLALFATPDITCLSILRNRLQPKLISIEFLRVFESSERDDQSQLRHESRYLQLYRQL